MHLLSASKQKERGTKFVTYRAAFRSVVCAKRQRDDDGRNAEIRRGKIRLEFVRRVPRVRRLPFSPDPSALYVYLIITSFFFISLYFSIFPFYLFLLISFPFRVGINKYNSF